MQCLWDEVQDRCRLPSAVVGDIIDVCRNIVHDSCGRIGCCCYKNLEVKDITDTKSKFFLRLEVADKQGVLAILQAFLVTAV